MSGDRKIWYKHYPSDWRADKKLRLVSRAARSFWLDCIGLMQEEGSHRLEINGRPMTTKELADTLGDNPRTAKKLLKELVDFCVCSIDNDGFVISRRILRDFEKAEKDKLNGRKGGNPALKTREKPEGGVNPEVKAQKLETRDYIETEPNGSDSVAVDATEVIWTKCKDWLVKCGQSDANARRLIGLWLKDNTPEVVRSSFKEAWAAKTQDPVPYITKILQPKESGPSAEEISAVMARALKGKTA